MCGLIPGKWPMGHKPFPPKLKLQMPATSTLWLALNSILRKGQVFKINQQVYESPAIGADHGRSDWDPSYSGGSLHVSVWTVKPYVPPLLCLTFRVPEKHRIGRGWQKRKSGHNVSYWGTRYLQNYNYFLFPSLSPIPPTMLLSFFPVSQGKRIIMFIKIWLYTYRLHSEHRRWPPLLSFTKCCVVWKSVGLVMEGQGFLDSVFHYLPNHRAQEERNIRWVED